MSRKGFFQTDALLSELIRRHEANPSATRLTARIELEAFPNIETQDAFFGELAELEREGGIKVVRRRVAGEWTATGVSLLQPEVLYRRLGRDPSRIAVAKALSRVRQRSDLLAGAHEVIDEVGAAWERGVSRYGIAPLDDVSLGQVLDLAAAAGARSLEVDVSEVDYRTFSRRTARDSKALERQLPAVVHIMMTLFPQLDDGLKLRPAERLASAGIVRLAQPLLLAGPIVLDGESLPALPFVGLPPEEGSRVGLSGPATYVLTVENYASFVRHVREISSSDGGLVLYTGGFPSRAALAAIVRIASLADVPIFHWGDMDAGGVRIFRHLELALATCGIRLRPHLMDPQLLRDLGSVAERQPGIRRGQCTDSAITTLWDLIALEHLVHEQEELSPTRPL
ncbi:hypothetical protein E2493_09870 [Sphingomonas parva]|uniref:Wadjet protein JetD C-terminal domain-containing protein n=1 Tax=Sphingomonas parva TaxID=2555898 RepID=A0A4Y8ZR09_9SPHN|nr:Wadjet anti-phage system protein JetD domain-containing protein [Sphingomonas parva]TFI58433.1 hypothetical protein E2493_09870 [Sphingomonas parva]